MGLFKRKKSSSIPVDLLQNAGSMLQHARYSHEKENALFLIEQLTAMDKEAGYACIPIVIETMRSDPGVAMLCDLTLRRMTGMHDFNRQGTHGLRLNEDHVAWQAWWDERRK